MPNHWESSARPLFVKTVFINGNRHAILFEKDPLLNCGNFPFKKISRSNSSLSFDSDLSTSSSESQDTYVEGKPFNIRNTDQYQRKDLSSDLQGCLVKLKLASGSSESKSKLCREKCFCNSKEVKKSQSTERRAKRHKWIHEETFKREHDETLSEEPKGHELTGRKSRRSNSCYVYNLENNFRKKNYCFVKISSQTPQFILNCNCENNWKETHKCNAFNKNNLVISATIHNIVMPFNGSENLPENTFDYVFENSELHWNNYLTKSYYNSLSEKVLQWLDLTRKRKKTETSILARDDEVSNNIERIFSGKAFADEVKKTEYSSTLGRQILTNKKMGKTLQKEMDEERDKEVPEDSNRETVVPAEELRDTDLKWFFRDSLKFSKSESENVNTQSSKISKETIIPTDSNLSSKDTTKELTTSILNTIKSPIKIQDLLLNYNLKESYSFRDQNKTKMKEISDASRRRNKQKKEENSEDEENLVKATLQSWEKNSRKKSNHINKSNSYNRESQCHCSKNLDDYTDNIKSHTFTGEFEDKNQQSINNLNITQTRPLLIQNLLSPQQQSKITYLQEEKIVWASEKNKGKPQLHIFLPTTHFRDHSDDSMSEGENFLNT